MLQTLGNIRNARREAGAIPVILAIAVVVVFFVGCFLFITLLSNHSSSSTEDENLDSYSTDSNLPVTEGVVTDCLFYNKNPRVRKALATDANFLKSLVYYSKGLGYHQNDMISVFRIECDFSWHVVNAFGCGGMFQLCPISEKVTGISGRQLASLQPSQQMPYMYRYFKAFGCDRDPPASKTMTNAYLCVFLPAYRKVAPQTRIWKRGVNPLHDVDNDGWIYKWEVDCNMTSSYAIGSRSCGYNLPLCSRSKVLPRKEDY